MSWLSVLSLGLKTVRLIARLVADRRLMAAGEDRAIARSLADIQVSLGIADQVEAEVARMTAAQVDKALEKDFRD